MLIDREYGLKTISPPSGLMVEVALAKKQCLVEHDLDDDLIESFIRSNTMLLEKMTGLLFFEQVRRLSLNGWPNANMVELYGHPVNAVNSVSRVAEDGTVTVYTCGVDYKLWLDRSPVAVMPLWGEPWPDSDFGDLIAIEYACGMPASQIPELAKQAVLMETARNYANRGDAAKTDISPAFKSMATSLWVGRYS